jgi:hypothetical protein
LSDLGLSAEGEPMQAIQLELDFRNAHSWCGVFADALAEPEVADALMIALLTPANYTNATQ